MSKKKNKFDLSADEVKNLTGEELGLELNRLRGELYGLRVQSVTGKIEDNSAFSKTKKSVARLLTERTARHRQPASTKTRAARTAH